MAKLIAYAKLRLISKAGDGKNHKVYFSNAPTISRCYKPDTHINDKLCAINIVIYRSWSK